MILVFRLTLSVEDIVDHLRAALNVANIKKSIIL